MKNKTAIPIYEFNNATKKISVHLGGIFSDYDMDLGASALSFVNCDFSEYEKLKLKIKLFCEVHMELCWNW